MKYRKRPMDVEAFQWTGELSVEFCEWADTVGFLPASLDGDSITVEILGGTCRASPGDWILRGDFGNFSVVEPHTFKANYEPADGHEDIAAWGAEHLKLASDK